MSRVRIALALLLIITLETSLNARAASGAHSLSSQSLLGAAIKCQKDVGDATTGTIKPPFQNSELHHSCADCLPCLLLGTELDARFDSFYVPPIASKTPPIRAEHAAPTSPQRKVYSARAPPLFS
jgi:hypothetical protein